MTHDKITSTRETLSKDADHLKREAGHMVEDLKKHASAHVDAAKDKLNDTFDLARNCIKEHPLKLIAGALLVGYFIGIFRRR